MAPARPYTVSEDAEIIRLKERLPFTGWSDLAVAFNATFAAALPRPWGTMQVRYSRYLAAGKHHRVRALAALAAAPAAAAPAAPAAAVRVPRAFNPRRAAPTAPAAAGPSAPPPAAAAAPPPPPPVTTTAAADAEWVEPQLDPANHLSRGPSPGAKNRGVPRAETAAARRRQHAAWEREFDVDCRQMLGWGEGRRKRRKGGK